MGITLSYIISFLIFGASAFLEWSTVLKRKKSRYLWIIFMILSGIIFLLSAYADDFQIKKRSQIASEMVNKAFDENPDQYSSWFEKQFSEEEKLLDSYFWDRENLDLESGTNVETAGEMLQNICMGYLVKTITVLNSEDLTIEEFRKDKGKWLGKYMDLSGTCYLRTDASELFFTKEFTKLNPDCEIAAFYYTYPNGDGKFIVWRPDTKWAPEKAEDANYPDAIYIGEVIQDGETFDIFVRNE